MKYIKKFNESFNIEDIEDYLLSFTDIGYLEFEGYTFLILDFEYYLVYNYKINSKFDYISTPEGMIEYSKFLTNLASTCEDGILNLINLEMNYLLST